MGRRELREQIFKLLFRVEFNTMEEMPEQCAMFFEDQDNQTAKRDEGYIKAKFEQILDKLEDIDNMLNERATGWRTDRMGKVDLTILRLAVYEISFDEEVPTGVAINEAVELAKKFGQDGSSSFINGVLARFANPKSDATTDGGKADTAKKTGVGQAVKEAQGTAVVRLVGKSARAARAKAAEENK